jgi:raffinose/stachyose/melibiose transport system permease protein
VGNMEPITEKKVKYKKTETKADSSILTFLRKKGFIYLFLLPTFALVILFSYKPAFSALYHSFFMWDGYNPGIFVGLNHFKRMLSDPMVIASAKNIGIIISAQIVIVLTLPLLAAELVYNLKSPKLQYFYRVMFTIPLVIPLVVIILVWQFIYDPNIGIINSLLGVLGLEDWARNWLGNTGTALFAIILIGFPWVSGLQFLLYLAALENISLEVIESSRLDGLGAFRRVWKIDLPIIMGQFKVIIVLTIITALQVFPQVYVLTNGGPGNATMVPGVALYQNAFFYGTFGYASAIGTALFIVTLIITLINNKILKSDVN